MNAKNKMSIADIAYNGACGILFTLFALICIFPFYYLFICTISDPSLVEVGKIVLLPRGITLKNYIEEIEEEYYVMNTKLYGDNLEMSKTSKK